MEKIRIFFERGFWLFYGSVDGNGAIWISFFSLFGKVSFQQDASYLYEMVTWRASGKMELLSGILILARARCNNLNTTNNSEYILHFIFSSNRILTKHWNTRICDRTPIFLIFMILVVNIFHTRIRPQVNFHLSVFHDWFQQDPVFKEHHLISVIMFVKWRLVLKPARLNGIGNVMGKKYIKHIVWTFFLAVSNAWESFSIKEVFWNSSFPLRSLNDLKMLSKFFPTTSFLVSLILCALCSIESEVLERLWSFTKSKLTFA